MATTPTSRKRFSVSRESTPLPDLIEVQKDSYRWFLSDGLRELFEEVSPVRDFIGRDLELWFENYYLDAPKFDEVTSRAKNLTYESPLRVNTKLVNKKSGKVVAQEVYLGDFPIMTDRGTFIINGIDRVVVSQLIRSAGVFFTQEVIGERKYYGAKIIPNRGSWLEIETDANGVIWVKIDRKRKVAITSLLRAFGYPSDEEVIALFADVDLKASDGTPFIQRTIAKDIAHNEAEGLKEVYKRIRPGDLATVDNAKALIYAMFFNFDRYDFGRVGRYKLNQRFNTDISNTKENRVLLHKDLINTIREIIRLNVTQKDADDIDHLGNRRVASSCKISSASGWPGWSGSLRIGCQRWKLPR